jgi:hypothetical protein
MADPEDCLCCGVCESCVERSRAYYEEMSEIADWNDIAESEGRTPESWPVIATLSDPESNSP